MLNLNNDCLQHLDMPKLSEVIAHIHEHFLSPLLVSQVTVLQVFVRCTCAVKKHLIMLHLAVSVFITNFSFIPLRHVKLEVGSPKQLLTAAKTMTCQSR